MTTESKFDRTIIELKDGRKYFVPRPYRTVKTILARSFQDESPFIEVTPSDGKTVTIAIDVIAVIRDDPDDTGHRAAMAAAEERDERAAQAYAAEHGDRAL